MEFIKHVRKAMFVNFPRETLEIDPDIWNILYLPEISLTNVRI